jgi:arylsulfatase A-like enzyme
MSTFISMFRAKTITLFFALSIVTFFSVNAHKHKQPEKRPNIVLLLADDMGYGELGSYGQEVIRTPFLDSLAEVGLKFTEFYAGSALCAPSRAVLMTGKHTGHTSVRGNRGKYSEKRWDRIALDKSEMTIGELLQNAGYQTAMIGKWHLGISNDKTTWAKKRGFDYAVQEQWGFNKRKKYDERVHWVNNNEDSIFYDYNQYKCLDEFRTNFALEYLESKTPNQPFFLYMSYRIPHAHEFFLSPYEHYDEFKQEWPEIERRHAARITMLDEQIRRLFHTLKEKGELENTIIIFTSDNGPHQEHFHKYRFFNSSGGLRGHKRDLYEGGIKVPMIVYWKGKINEGRITNHPATFYDFMPTIAQKFQSISKQMGFHS